MGTFITKDNWILKRIGAAIFGWSTTPTSGLEPEPAVVSVSGSREYFTSWPLDWSLKVRSDCGGHYGKLSLEVKQTEVSFNNTSEMYQTDIDYYLGNPAAPTIPAQYAGGLYSYVRWGGDNHQYDTYTTETYDSGLLTNPGDPGHPLWGIEKSTAVFNFPDSYDPGAVVNVYYTDSSAYTGPASPYVANPANGTVSSRPYLGESVDMTGASILTPQDVLDGWGTSVTTTTGYFNHKPGASHWNRSATVSKTTVTIAADQIYDQINTNGITFVWDEAWPACGYIQKITCDLRWKYDPQSSVGCKWWEGYQASVKIAYKRATVSRASGPNGVFLTIGSFSAAGDNTQTITLHDQYTEEYVSSTITMPSSEGYVYVIDDIEVLSVTKP